MINRQALIDELQELRTLVLKEDQEQVQLRVRLLIDTCDRLTKPLGHAADDAGLSLPLVRSLRGYVAEAGFAVESDPRRALKALDQALLAVRSNNSCGAAIVLE